MKRLEYDPPLYAEHMKVLLAVDPEGVRVDQVVTVSLRDELAAAKLLTALHTELSGLDHAVRSHFARSGKRGAARRPPLTLVPPKN